MQGKALLALVVVVVLFIIIAIALSGGFDTDSSFEGGTRPVRGRLLASRFGRRANAPLKTPIREPARGSVHPAVLDVLRVHNEAINQYMLLQRGEWGSPSFLRFRHLLSEMLAKAKANPGMHPKSVLEVADSILVGVDAGADSLHVPDSDAWKRMHGFIFDLLDRCSEYLSAHMNIGTTVDSQGRGIRTRTAAMISQALTGAADIVQPVSSDPDAEQLSVETIGQNMLETLDYLDSGVVGSDPELSAKASEAYRKFESRRSGAGNFPRARRQGQIAETAAELSQTLYDVDTRRTPLGKVPGGNTNAYEVESTFVRFPTNSVNRAIFGPKF